MNHFFSTLTLSILLLIAISLGSISCKSQESEASKVDITQMSDPTNLYLMLRIVENPKGEGFDIVSVEKEIIAKQGNPLPSNQTQENLLLFKCELHDKSDKIIFTQDQKAEFIYGKNNNEAIVKFIIPLPEDAEKVVVKYESKDSNWLEVYTDTVVH